jgi:hypothetical protein
MEKPDTKNEIQSKYTIMKTSRDEPSDFEREQLLFEKARELLKPGRLSRFVTYLYAERKLLVFFLVHFICTIIIWSK